MVRGRKNPLYFGLALRLKKARRESGLKRLHVAARAGLARATGRTIETGNRLPTVGTIASLAGALDVSASWLAYGIGDMHINGAPATCDGMGARLQQLRVEQGHTKAALARFVGLSPSTVADIEYGAQTGVEVIEALAKALCISPAWLAFNQGSRELPVRRRSVTEAESAQASD